MNVDLYSGILAGFVLGTFVNYFYWSLWMGKLCRTLLGFMEGVME